MAKKQSFADKMKKERGGSLCAVCGGATQAVKTVRPEQDADTGAWKFRTRKIGRASCRERV